MLEMRRPSLVKQVVLLLYMGSLVAVGQLYDWRLVLTK